MAIRASSPSLQETETQSITINKCFSYSIQPVVIWLRILGVNLPDVYSTSRHLRYRWLMHFYGVLSLVTNVLSQITILYYLYSSRKEAKLELAGGTRFNTAVASWNLTIDFCNYVLNGLGTHIIFIFVIRPRWLALIEIFQRSQSTLNGECFNLMRKMSFLGITYIIIVICGLLMSVVGYHYAAGSSVYRMGISFLSTISVVHPMTGLLLYTILCYASSLTFESILTEIKYSQIQLGNDRVQNVSLLLLTCKRLHIFACDTVDAINYCFGSMLLIATAFFIVAVINSSFYLFSHDKASTISDFTFSSTALFHLVVMCFATDRVRNKAQDAMNELLKLNFDEPLIGSKTELMNLFSNLLSEMAHTIPQITSGGYFSINKELFPKVIGTTLTYFFILYQLETSEAN